MEARITKMERDFALMSQTLTSIALTLEKMSNVQVDTRLLEERQSHLDRDLQESFTRVHKRIDAERDARIWTGRTVIAAIVVGMTEFVFRITT